MAISKTNSITTAAIFDTWWIRSLKSFSPTFIQLMFAPSNREYLLVSETKSLNLNISELMINDSIFAEIMSSFYTEAQRQYSLQNNNPIFTNFSVEIFTVASISPTNPTCINFRLLIDENLVDFNIPDIFKLAMSDSTFAGILDNFINEMGRQGKLAGIID